MKVNTKELAEALNRFQDMNLSEKGLGDEQLGLVTIDNDRVYGVSHSNSVMVILNTPIGINQTVRFKEMFDLLTKIRTENISISQNKKDKKILIETKSTRAEINASFPEVNHGLDRIKGKWKNLPNDFINGLRLCYTTTSDDDSQTLSCMNITSESICSCDNIRISKHQWKNHIDIKDSVLIPSENTNRLTKFEPTSLLIDEKWFYFKNKRKDILGIRKVEMGKYPELDDFLKIKSKSIVNLPLKSKDSLARAGIFGINEVTGETIVNIMIEKNQLIFDSQSEAGKIIEKVKIDYKGNKIQFSMDPNALVEIFNYKNDSDYIPIKVGDTSILFEGKGFKYLACVIGEEKR